MKTVLNYLKENVALGRLTRATLVLTLALAMFSCSKDDAPSESNEVPQEVCGTKVSHRQSDYMIDGSYRYYIKLNNDGEFAQSYRVSLVEYDRYKMRNGEFICITPLNN